MVFAENTPSGRPKPNIWPSLSIITSSQISAAMAADICDEVIILKEGHMLGFGLPDGVFSAKTISSTFQVTASYERLAPSDKNLLTFNL